MPEGKSNSENRLSQWLCPNDQIFPNLSPTADAPTEELLWPPRPPCLVLTPAEFVLS